MSHSAKLKKNNTAIAEGFKHGAYEGNELQLPALLIAGKDWLVSYAHYARNLSDIESADKIVELLGQGRG